MNNNNEALNNNLKRGRGRPKGSKNKPKVQEEEQEIQVQQKARQVIEKKVPIKVAVKKGAKKQLDTFFIIKPRSGGKCYYQTEIIVDYTPYKEHDQDKVSIVPRLNTDNKPHIPGFIMDMDKGYYDKHDQRYKEDHEAKISDYTKPKTRLYQPKPGKRHNYCCVCKQSYDDYLDHVQSNQHKKAYNNNEFSQFIKKLGKDYDSNQRNNIKHQEQPEPITDTLTPLEDEEYQRQLTDSATQKYGNKGSNEKGNKGNSQYITNNSNNNNIYQNQMIQSNNLKKTSSQMNVQEQLKVNYLSKSVSLNLKGGLSTTSAVNTLTGTASTTGANNYHDASNILNYQQNLSTQPSCIALSTKQTSSTNNYQQPLQYAITSNPNNFQFNIPFSNDNEIIVNDGHNNNNNNIHHLSNHNSHNNSLNSNHNNNNNNNTGSKNYKNNLCVKSTINNNNNNIIAQPQQQQNNASSTTLNAKRKGENYGQYNDNLESTRKYQFQNSLNPKQIIDLTTEEGNNNNNPTQKQSQSLINITNPPQTRLSSNGQYIMCAPQQYVVCND